MKKIFYLVLFLFVLNLNSVYSQNSKNLIVLVKYKTLPGKESLALSTIKSLISDVKKEPNYIDIIIHIDPFDKSNILLYEKWSSEDYYKGDHMKTQHLLQFMNDARSFLGGPPEITFWNIEN